MRAAPALASGRFPWTGAAGRLSSLPSAPRHLLSALSQARKLGWMPTLCQADSGQDSQKVADDAPSCASVLPGPEGGTRPLSTCRVDLTLAGATGTGTVGTEHSPALVPVSCTASDKKAWPCQQ